MKKRLSIILLCSIILLSVCGCSSKESNTENKDTKEDFAYIGTITGIEDENVILSSSSIYYNLVVTDNNFYSVSFDKLYSNDTNYKQVEGVSNINGIQYDDLECFFIYDNKGNMGYYADGKASLSSKSTFNYDFKLKNGKVYVDNDNNVYIDDNQLIENNSISSEENIIGIYLSGSNYYFKTDKAFYRLKQTKKATNKEQCEKYADIKCEYVEMYEIVKEEKLTNHIQDIKYIVKDKIVFNNNKVYSLN